MKEKELLSLMFADATEFRAELLEETLRKVRRRRRIQRAGQVCIALALFTAALWWTVPRRTISAPPSVAALEIIHTQPIRAEQIVTTQASSLVVVEDDELLALVPGETKLLVWHAPDRAELVILDGSAVASQSDGSVRDSDQGQN